MTDPTFGVRPKRHLFRRLSTASGHAYIPADQRYFSVDSADSAADVLATQTNMIHEVCVWREGNNIDPGGWTHHHYVNPGKPWCAR